MPNELAKYLPLDPVEHENDLRSLILRHMGTNQGNPTQWVVNAVAEAFQQGFGVGFEAGHRLALAPPASPPAFRVQIPKDSAAGRQVSTRFRRDDPEIDDITDIV